MRPSIPKGLSKKKKGKAVPAPVTIEDFLDCGVEEEEHGDRWIDSGDVPKALRFYQKAFTLYMRAVDMGRQRGPATASDDVKFVQDAAFNVARMQYVVYSKVVKTGLIDEMPNVVPSEGGVVPASLEDVARAHEQALALIQQGVPTDLLYTNGQVLAELGEERESAEILSRALESFQKVFEYQVNELKQTVNIDQVAEGGSVIAPETTNATQKTEEMSVGQAVTPSSTVETIVSCLDCLNTLLEICRDEDSPYITPQPAVANYVTAALAGIHIMVRDFFNIVTQFGVEGTDSGTFVSVSQTLAQETAIAIAQLLSTCAESLELLTSIWTSSLISQESVETVGKVLGTTEHTVQLPETTERYMAASDAFLGYIERPRISPEDQWTAYGKASALLKRAWEVVQPSTPVLVKLQLLVARGDVDFLRSRLPIPAADKNKAVLQKNAGNMYVSAINLPSSRMSISEGGTAGQQIRNEARAKLLVVQGKQDEIQGVPGWQRILSGMQSQGII